MKFVAVIGLGNIAIRHRRNLKSIFPDAKLISMSASGRVPEAPISDSDITIKTIDELLFYKPKLVIVASPASLHAKHAIPLIQEKIPVLIEKPVSTNKFDAQQLINETKKFETPVSVGYCLRYLPSVQIVKQLLKENAIGKIYNAFIEIGQYLPDWRPNKDYRTSVSASRNLGGGVLLELSHEIDYAQWFLGSLSIKHAILRSSSELDLDVEDFADLVMTNSDECIINIHLDFIQKKAYRKCRLIGSKGCIELDLIKNKVILISTTDKKIIYDEPKWDKNRMYIEMLLDFIKKINNQPNQCISLDEAESTISLIESIHKSSKITKVK